MSNRFRAAIAVACVAIISTPAVATSPNAGQNPPPQAQPQPQQQPQPWYVKKWRTVVGIAARLAGVQTAARTVTNNPVLRYAEPFLDPQNAANIYTAVKAARSMGRGSTGHLASAPELDRLMAEMEAEYAPPPAATPPPAAQPSYSPPPSPPPVASPPPPPSAAAPPAQPYGQAQQQLSGSTITGSTSPPAAPQPAMQQVAAMQPTNTTAPPPTPGGISLGFAAAAGLAVKLDLKGLHAEKGRVTFAGRGGAGQVVDTPLFLTAMRLACEGASPYMSLDADDGAAWSREADLAGKDAWDRIKSDFGYDDPVSADAKDGLTVRSVSMRRDYAQLWSGIAAKYPNLKTRLVFKPEWLKQTRFGEIMYVADVLLKELSAGVPTVQPSRELRAALVDGYKPSDVGSVLRGLTASVGKLPASSSMGSWRLWFDLAPDGLEASQEFRPTLSMLDDEHGSDPASLKLQTLMAEQGHLAEPGGSTVGRALAVASDAVDLSQVWPQMFVRGHDHASGKDIRGSSPDLIKLSADVNRRIASYAATYDELRQLTEVFRLYVAAVAIAGRSPEACSSVRIMPMLKTEVTQKPLPDNHPTEIAFTVASFTYGGKDGKRVWHYQTNTFNGGVTIRADDVVEKARAEQAPTPVTQEVASEAKGRFTDAAWEAKSGSEFVALKFDDPEVVGILGQLKGIPPEQALIYMHPRLAVLLSDEPTGTGMLDGTRPAVAPAAPAAKPAPGAGMLDDVTDKEGSMVVVPRGN